METKEGIHPNSQVNLKIEDFSNNQFHIRNLLDEVLIGPTTYLYVYGPRIGSWMT